MMLPDLVDEVEMRLWSIQRQHSLSSSVMTSILEFSRWQQAETALCLGVPVQRITGYVPLRRVSAKTAKLHATQNFDAIVSAFDVPVITLNVP